MSSHCSKPVNNRTTFNHIHTCSVITDSKDIVYSRWIHDALFTRSPACKDNHIERKYHLYIEQVVYAQVCSVSMNELPPPPPTPSLNLQFSNVPWTEKTEYTEMRRVVLVLFQISNELDSGNIMQVRGKVECFGTSEAI